MPPSSSPIEILVPDTAADEVAICAQGSALLVAYSRATLEGEVVVVARWAGGSGLEPLIEVDGYRPQVAVHGERAIVCVPSPRGAVSIVEIEADRVERSWHIGALAPVHRASCAMDGGHAFVAWDEWRDGQAKITVHRLEPGKSTSVCQFAEPGRWLHYPALAMVDGELHIACIDAPAGGPGHIALGRLDERPVPLQPGDAPQDAPVLCAGAHGAIVAWHELAATDGTPIRRWLRVFDVAKGELIDPPGEGDPDRASSGEDQGWEMPALCADGTDLWLLGRSAHRWWLSCHRKSGWSERTPVSEPGWGGRGTKGGLARLGGQIVMAKRDPVGVAVATVPAVSAGDAAAAAPAGKRTWPPRPSRNPDILFGDLHRHSAHSDGCGTIEDLWLDARMRGLDFAALSDHDRFCRRAIGPDTWRTMCQMADAFDRPGEFTALAAYEFTGPRHPGPGHKCVYFGDSRPERIPDKEVDAVFAAAREHGGLAVPHHVAWTGTDAEHHQPDVQPVWEIFSVHGCYECCNAPTPHPPRADVVLPGHFVCDALAAGLRFGFIASSDSHGLVWHHGVGPKRDPFATGLAAVFGAEPTRAGILSALKERRCYATTGARILCHIDLDGATMGSELPADTRGSLGISIRGTAPLKDVTLVTAGGERKVADPDGSLCEARVEVSLPPDREWTYLYVRVTQHDGEQAWTSPIWIG